MCTYTRESNGHFCFQKTCPVHCQLKSSIPIEEALSVFSIGNQSLAFNEPCSREMHKVANTGERPVAALSNMRPSKPMESCRAWLRRRRRLSHVYMGEYASRIFYSIWITYVVKCVTTNTRLNVLLRRIFALRYRVLLKNQEYNVLFDRIVHNENLWVGART